MVDNTNRPCEVAMSLNSDQKEALLAVHSASEGEAKESSSSSTSGKKSKKNKNKKEIAVVDSPTNSSSYGGGGGGGNGVTAATFDTDPSLDTSEGKYARLEDGDEVSKMTFEASPSNSDMDRERSSSTISIGTKERMVADLGLSAAGSHRTNLTVGPRGADEKDQSSRPSSRSPSMNSENAAAIAAAAAERMKLGGLSLSDLDEEERQEKAEREAYITRKWRGLLGVTLVEVLVFFLLYVGWIFHFNLDTLADDDILNYKYDVSFADVGALVLFKTLVHVINLAVLRSDEERSYFLSSASYWTGVLCLIAVVCKGIVLSTYSHPPVIVLEVFTFIWNLLGFYFLQGLRPKEGTNAWDPYEAEELEAKVGIYTICNTYQLYRV